jgi:RNA polymerase sigma factor (sigma-70 family)
MSIPIPSENLLQKTVTPIYEPDVWRAFQEGDQKAYAYIFRCYKDILYNYGLTFLADEALVCDCIQELFLDLWVKREKLAQVHSIKYYLLISFRRLVLSKIESARKYTYSLKESASYKNLEPIHSAETELIQEQFLSEQHEKLSETLNHLPRRQKEALYLRYYEKLSYEEIMQVMALSYKTVRNLVSLAIQGLRKDLNKRDFFYSLALLANLIF